MLHTARARALGKLGRIPETLAAVGQADDAFAQASPAWDPPWMAYYDQAQHYGDTAHALFDLAIHDTPGTEASQRLSAAVGGHTDAYARSRAISGTKLASLVMATRDPREATARPPHCPAAIGPGWCRGTSSLRASGPHSSPRGGALSMAMPGPETSSPSATGTSSCST